MADNVFSRSPLQNALGEIERRRTVRSVAPQAAVIAPVPQAPQSSAAAAPTETAPAEAFDPIADASAEYQVPHSALLAISEISGGGEAGSRLASETAARLAGPLSQGMTFSDALRATGAPDDFTAAVVSRAQQLYLQRNPNAPEAQVGLGERLAAGARDTAGATVRGAGRIASDLGAESVGEALTTAGDAIDATEETQARIAADRARRSEGKNMVGRVAANLGGDVAQAAPTLATSIGGAVVGGLVGGPLGAVAGGLLASFPMLLDESARTAAEHNENLDDPAVQNQIYAAAAVKTALEQVAPFKIIAKLGRGAPVERAATSIFRRVAKEGTETALLEGMTEVSQMAIDQIMLNPELREKLSEADMAEIAPYLAEQYGEEALTNFAVGAVLGGGAGGISGAIPSRAAPAAAPEEDTPDEAAAEPPAPLGLPAPALITPPPRMPSGGADAAEAPRSGPLEAALGEGPAAITPDAMPGAPVQIEVQSETGPQAFTGVLVGETPDGVRVKLDDGDEVVVGRDEIEAGSAIVSVVDPAAAAPAVDPAPMQPAPPAPAPGALSEAAAADAPAPSAPAAPAPQDNDALRARLDFLDTQRRQTGGLPKQFEQERAALRQQLGDIEAAVEAATPSEIEIPQPEAVAPPEPGEQPEAAPITRKDGTPFKTGAQARQAVRNRRLDPAAYEIQAEGGGFVARPAAQTPAPGDAEAGEDRSDVARQSPEDAVKTQDVAVEPVAPDQEQITPLAESDTVRMWHSGTGGDEGGPRWFSSNERYGRDYRPGEPAFYVDVPRSDPMFDADYDDQTVDQGFTVNKEFDPALYGGAKAAEPEAPTPADPDRPPPQLPAPAEAEPEQELEVAAAPAAEPDQSAAAVDGSPKPGPEGSTPSSGATLTVEHIREKAAIVRGGTPDAPPVDVPGVSLKWDAKADGWIFPRKHEEKVRAALGIADGVEPNLDTAPAAELSPPDAPAAPPSPKADSPRARREAKAAERRANSPRAKREARERAQADYFTPGNVVPAYGGGQDRIVSYSPPNENGVWSVEVEAVVKDGDRWIPDPARGGKRRHGTRPTDREIAAGPTERANAAPAQDAGADERDAPVDPMDAIAAEAARANPEPSDAQKEAGNYQLGHVKLHGLDVSIETAKGGERRGKAPDGTEWTVTLPAHYGYIRRTEGNDGDHVDVYLGEAPESDKAFIVDQFDPETGNLDEHKVVLGALTEADALAVYDGGFSDGSGPRRRKNVGATEMSVDEFKTWLRDGDQTKPAAKTQKSEPESQITPSGIDATDSVAPEADPDAPPAAAPEAVQPREEDGKFASYEVEAEPERVIEDGDGPSYSLAVEPARMALRDAGALRAVLQRGPLGSFVEKAIDAGRIVLHDTEATLPGEGGREGDGYGRTGANSLNASLSDTTDALHAPPSIDQSRASIKAGAVDQRPLDGMAERIDRVVPGAGGRGVIAIGPASDFLTGAGAPQLPLMITTGTVGKALAKHGMTHTDIKAALGKLYDPVFVMESAPAAHAPDGSLVVVVDMEVGGRPVAVAVHVAQQIGSGGLSVNEIKTLGGRSTQAIGSWLDQGLLLVRGRKAGAWLTRSGLQSPRGGYKHRLGKKILSAADVVKKSAAAPSGRIQGMTDADGVIHLVASNLTAETAMPVLLHEAFHAGGESVIGTPAWDGMMRRVDSILRRQMQNAAGGTSSDWWTRAFERLGPGQMNAEELAAYAIEERAGAPAGILEIVDRVLGEIQAFILRRFGRQIGAVTPAQLSAIAAAALRAAPLSPRPGVSYSLASAIPKAAAIAGERKIVSHALTKAMSGNTNLLALVPGRALFAELGKHMPASQDYLRLKEEMDALRNEWHARTDDVAQAWRKLGVRGPDNAALMDLMHDATLAGTDPAERFVSGLNDKDKAALAKGTGGEAGRIAAENLANDQGRRAKHAELRKRFNALPAPYQAMYRRVRDEHKALGDAFDDTLERNVTRAMEQEDRRAQRAHDDRLAEINDEGLTGEARDREITAAKRKLDRAQIKARMGRRSRMVDLRALFETQKVPAPYFPLARFGQFFVTTRDRDSGKVLSFSRFEGPRAQERFAAEQRKNPSHDVTVGTIGETALRDMVNPEFVAAVEGILDDAEVNPRIMDAVWQRWLETMPDLSLRKSRIHRKGTPGFERDAFRAFGHHMFHGAHQLARLRYSIDLDEALTMSERQAQRAPDPVRAGLVWSEMEKRHKWTMNPTGSWWSQAITSAAFVYYLSVTPAAALVNLSQTSIVGTAVLGAYGGVGDAAKQLGRALRDFGDGKGWAATSKRLAADEVAAMKEAYRRGTVDKSQAHDLAGVGESGIEYSAARNRVMSVISWGFHHTERMNREITFLAAYRMAKAKGLIGEDAIAKAADLTWKTHFDYSASSRPRLMHSDYTKVLFVFRNFQVNMLWRLFRDTHQAVKGESPEVRREARAQLAGITGMFFMHAGVRGIWGYSLAMALMALFFAGDADDLEDEMKGHLVETLGPNLTGMLLNGVPGHALGIDITNRVGMPDLWFRSPDRQLEGSSEYQFWVSQMLGAGVGMAENLWRGFSMVEDGHVLRGIETIAPKFVRDQIRAARYLGEGATTLNGDPIMEDMNWSDALRQSIGFVPAGLAERYRANSLLKKREREILDQRSSLMGAYSRAVRAGEKPPARLIERITTFNAENPTYPITNDSLRRSVQSRERASARMQGGVSLNPRLEGQLRDGLAPLVNG